MTGLRNVGRFCIGRDRLQNSVGALDRAYARSFAFGCIDRDGEVGFVLRAVVPDHQWKLQLPCTFYRDWHADQAAGFT